MINPTDLEKVPLFGLLSAMQRERICRTAADLHVRTGDWLAREGDLPRFFVVLEGRVEFLKNFGGVTQTMVVYESEDCFGEVPLLLGARVLVGLRAREASRVLRLDASSFYELIAESQSWRERILEVMTKRVAGVHEIVCKNRTPRVVIVGDDQHARSRDILNYLSRIQIPYSWLDRKFDLERLPTNLSIPTSGLTAIVDGQRVLCEPTEREMAEALGIQTSPGANVYDVVIVGAGPSGLAAAVCGSSEGLKVLVVEQAMPGGQAGTSSRIENYLGFPAGISGGELSDRAIEQVNRFGAEIVISRKVERIDLSGEGKILTLDGDVTVTSRSVILATGVEWRLLDADGIDRMIGRGVVYGASQTEAMAVIGKNIFIVGGGNSAGQAALFFSSYAASVTVVIRGEGLAKSMSQYLITEIACKANIFTDVRTEIIAVDGLHYLETVTTKDRNTGDIRTREADALFVMIGASANTAWLPGELLRDEHGYLCTGRDIGSGGTHPRAPYPLETTVPGIFCVGDVRHGSIKRVASGVGEGSMVISFIHQYLALSYQGFALAELCPLRGERA